MLDDDTKTRIAETRAKNEFLTFLVLANGQLRVGIVQNESQKMVMFYDYEKIRGHEARKKFLRFGDQWWWGSNQSIPVDSFIGDDFDHFHEALTGYPKKSIDETHGPTFSLHEQYLKRVKKKKIEIVNTRQAIVTA